MATISVHAPAATLPVTLGQLRVLLVADQAVHEAYGGKGVTWDGPSNSLKLTAEPDVDGAVYSVTVSLRRSGTNRSTVDVVASLATAKPLTPAERLEIRNRLQADALHESHSIVAHLMEKVAKGVGRGFADRPSLGREIAG